MHKLLRLSEVKPLPSGSLALEGKDFSSSVSIYFVKNLPGEGPNLHRHPYGETWILQSGKALFTADGEEIEGGPGDVIAISPGTPHKFKNTGDERLDIICIHASPTFIQEELE
jgi:mannose-6-phosphate isomerase-like protein (cupin superfamily)